MDNKKKLSKGRIRAIIVAAISAAVALTLIITDIFIPVKYLASYMVIRNGGSPEGVMRVRFIDVGFGDSTLIEFPDGKNMLIDAGNGESKYQSRILKTLNKCGIGTIDYLVCSSVNAEYCGGLTEIIRYKTVKNIYAPYCKNTYITEEYRSFIAEAGICGAKISVSEYGAGEECGLGSFFKFLSPSAHTLEDGEYAKLNSENPSLTDRDNSSAVIWLEYAGTSFLLTGGAGNEALTKISESYNLFPDDYPVSLKDCTIMKMANHGASGSACAVLYDTAKPEAAILSVGENGRGCPSANALSNALNYVGAKLYRTDELGTIMVEVTEGGYKFI